MPVDKKRIFPQGLILLWAALLVVLVFLRAPYGTDVTDEAYWVAEPYLVTQGAIPLADNWSQTPLTGLLIAPLISLYTTLAGGTQGIVLYMMCVTIVFRIAAAAAVWLLLRRQMGQLTAAVCALLLFSCNMGHTRSLNYSILSLYLLALAGALLYNAVSQEDVQKAAGRCAGAGVVMALCALAHVTQLFNCILFAVILLFLERRTFKKLPLWLIYGLSGLLVAVIVTAALEAASGGRLFSGLGTLLRENNYFRIPHLSFREQVFRCAHDFQFFILRRGIPLFLLFFAVFSLLSFLKTRSCKERLSQILTYSLLSASGVLLAWMASRRGDMFSSDTAAFILFLTAPCYLLWMDAPRRHASRPLLFFFWLPCLVSLLSIAAASHSAANYRYYVLSAGAVLAFPLACATLRGTSCFPGKRGERHGGTGKGSALPFAVAVLFSAAMLVNLWTNVYRDDVIPQLTYRVESGVYKGCYTSPKRGQALEVLEQRIRTLTDDTESVLFCDLFPAGYLMTEAPHCTPTTWDPCMYRYGFQDAELFLRYFEQRGETPERILFVNSEESPLSIDDPENQFAAFVRTHYTLTDEEGEGLFSFRVFTKNEE